MSGRRRANTGLMAAGIAVLMAAGAAQAQTDRPRPLQALERAFDNLRQLGERGAAAARERRSAGEGRRRAPAASPQIARLPHPRPAAALSSGPPREEPGAQSLRPEAAESADDARAPDPPAMDADRPPEPESAVAAIDPPEAADRPAEQAIRLPRSRPAPAEERPSVAATLSEPAPLQLPPPAAADLLETPPDLLALKPPVAAFDAIGELTRLPRPRPAANPALALLEPGEVERPPEAPMAPPVILSADEASCFDRLHALGVTFERADPIGSGACYVDVPLQVTALGSGVGVGSAVIMNCRTAEALALWVKDIMVPAARTHLRAAPTAIAPGSTYACRPRNNQEGAKLSEHARANAFDVMAIAFADRESLEVTARGSASPEGKFQAAIRQGSCSYFTTVIGPGSDAAHANHLHFDLAERSGGYRLCQ